MQRVIPILSHCQKERTYPGETFKPKLLIAKTKSSARKVITKLER